MSYSPTAQSLMQKIHVEGKQFYSADEFMSVIDALSDCEKKFTKSEHRREAFARERKILAWNEEGFAVRFYDIDTDEFMWKYGGKLFGKTPTTKQLIYECGKPEFPQYRLSGDNYLCDIEWLRKNQGAA